MLLALLVASCQHNHLHVGSCVQTTPVQTLNHRYALNVAYCIYNGVGALSPESEVLMYPPRVLCTLTQKHTCTVPHPLPQTHMNLEWKELKEITQLTMFHKRSVQDILYEWTPRSPPPTNLAVSHLILFPRLLFSNDKWGRPWNQPAQGLQETVWEAPPSVCLKQDIWQVKWFNMMETQIKPGVIEQK